MLIKRVEVEVEVGLPLLCGRISVLIMPVEVEVEVEVGLTLLETHCDP